MNIVKSTKRYEAWLAGQTRLVAPDLALKHRAMAADPFRFLRATFYRWVQVWPKLCRELAAAPSVLAVGDLHIENFGTWRDTEGRLIWGVNDFDEAYQLPYTNDLVRLAVSALLAVDEGHLSITGKQACRALLDGYQGAIHDGGRPFVLGEHNSWLRQIAESDLRDPVHFWAKMDGFARVRVVAKSAIEAMQSLMPEQNLPSKIVHRIAGLGSLGRQRFVTIAQWRGGRIAREAKAILPSACCWLADAHAERKTFYETIITRAVRCLDPFVHLRAGWIVRRLSPHCSRIEIETLPEQRDELRLLHSMGWETGNIHLGSQPARKRVRGHLDKQRGSWLYSAAKEMKKAVRDDWKDWKNAIS